MQKTVEWWSKSLKLRPRVMEPGPVPTIGEVIAGESKWFWAHLRANELQRDPTGRPGPKDTRSHLEPTEASRFYLAAGAKRVWRSAVPRYYLDLIEGDKRKVDRSGILADDLQCAERVAKESARNFMVSKLLKDEDPDGRRYEIIVKANRILATVCFRDLLPKAVMDAHED